MPATLQPGVYIEEIPSGVRTITGVATSITAFVGRALRGTVDSDDKSPVRIFNFADYQRIFGGLSVDSPMSFAVLHYFLNGGSDALIVRVHKEAKTAQTPAAPAAALFSAANPGAWGARVRLRVDHAIDADVEAANVAAGFPANTLFNLKVKDLGTGVTETFLNVSITAGHPRFVSEVLRQSSRLLRGAATFATRPAANGAPAATATDPFDDPSATALTGGTDGSAVGANEVATGSNLRDDKKGLFALEKADLFNLLSIPPFAPDKDVDKTTWDAAVAYAKERRAMVLVDPPFNTNGWDEASDVTASAITDVASRSENAAIFFPRIKFGNSLRENRPEPFAPCGAVAGVIARTDASRGVWKSAAGIDATLNGALGLSVNLTDPENGVINPLGVNCLRSFATTGPIVWGSRTLKGADSLASEWKYLAVRRTALFLEESLYRGTQWVVFEPNDEPLWAQIRLNIGALLQNLFRQGAFQGKSPREAYFVKCDRETTTQTDINLGIVNILVGFAPLKPAEFVVIKIQQIAGDIPT
jgi:phage tail sheath protein FI